MNFLFSGLFRQLLKFLAHLLVINLHLIVNTAHQMKFYLITNYMNPLHEKEEPPQLYLAFNVWLYSSVDSSAGRHEFESRLSLKYIQASDNGQISEQFFQAE